jgi:hypothetical protein
MEYCGITGLDSVMKNMILSYLKYIWFVVAQLFGQLERVLFA